VTLNYSTSEDDFLNFYQFCLLKSPSQKRTLNILRFGGALFFIAIDTFFLVKASSQLGDQFLPFLLSDPAGAFLSFGGGYILALVCILFTPGFFRRCVKLTAKQLLKEGWSSEFIGRHTVTLLDETLKDVNEELAQEVSYSKISLVEETDKHIYLLKGGAPLMDIPLNAFNGQDEINAFLKLLQEKTPNAARKVRPR